MDVLVTVTGQAMNFTENSHQLAAGTQEYVKFIFDLSDDWKNLHTFVQFCQNKNSYNIYLDEDNSAYLPTEIKNGIFSIALQGNLGNTIAKTNLYILNINKDPIYIDNNSTVMSVELYNQLAGQFGELDNRVTALEDDEQVKSYVESVVEQIMQDYLDHDYFAALSIGDGTIQRIKITAEFEGDLQDMDAAATNANNRSISNQNTITQTIIPELERLSSDFYYKPVEITSFSVTPNIAEIGSTVSSVELSYAINKVPDSLTLNGNSITPASSGTETDTTPVTSNVPYTKVYTLIANDSGSATVEPVPSQKTASLSFVNRVYYGAKASGTINSSFVTSLSNSPLSNTKTRKITINVPAGQYAWYAYPKRLGTCTFSVGGFDGGFEAPVTVSVQNASGVTEDFYVYRSTNSGIGNQTIVVN